MCVVSKIADDWLKKNSPEWDWVFKGASSPTRAEFEKLKKEVEELKKALKKGKEEDKKTGNPDCEMEEKIVILRKIASAIGISLDDIFERKK